eukprot:gb/GEZN01004849.1/.p1 GENE.gb/GEZN01004849.1/~~gb/GEZN01004849.1/.p1  ORF type:complete len:551 (-),score=76.33 gb/GEZN01004849.1/:159-1811(-)
MNLLRLWLWGLLLLAVGGVAANGGHGSTEGSVRDTTHAQGNAGFGHEVTIENGDDLVIIKHDEGTRTAETFPSAEILFLESADEQSAKVVKEGDVVIDIFIIMKKMNFLTAMVVAILVVLITALGAIGGIGGGAILLPLFVMVGGFETKHAVPLSNFIIFSSTVVAFGCNCRKSHPDHPNRPLINVELAVMLEIMTIAGTVFGVLLNTVCPTSVVSICASLIILFLTFKMTRKAMRMHREEQQQRLFKGHPSQQDAYCSKVNSKEQDHADEASSGETQHKEPLRSWRSAEMQNNFGDAEKGPLLEVLGCRKAATSDKHVFEASYSSLPSQSEEFEASPSKDRFSTPWHFLGLLVVAECLVIVSQLLRRAANAGDHIFFLTVAPLPFLVILTALTGIAIVRSHADHAASDCLHGEIHWTPARVVVYPAIGCVAGILAGLLGIGGGIVKAPLMLHLGIAPVVARATSLTMILFTSFSCVIQYFLLGRITLCTSLLAMFLGVLGALLGELLVHDIKKYNRASLIVFILAVGMFLSLPPMIWVTFGEVSHDVAS